MSEFITYYNTVDSEYNTYDFQTGQYEIVSVLPRECNKFEMLTKKYEANQEGLKLYANALYKANEEIKKTKILPFKYDIFDDKVKLKVKPIYQRGKNIKKQTRVCTHMWRCSATMALSLFKRLTPSRVYSMLEQLNADEIELTALAPKSTVMYASKEVELENAHSYDFRMYYPSLMASDKFFFPTCPGEYIDFPILNLNLQYGYYNCEITISNSDVRKIFVFSKAHWYTHYAIIMALKLKKQYNCVEIKPLGKAYIYTEDKLVCGNQIFGHWYSHLKMLKEKFPKNIIIKAVSSSLWGYLVESNVFKCGEIEAEEKYKMTTTMDPNKGDYHIHNYVETRDPAFNHYKLLDLSKYVQKHPFRIKNFITGMARLDMCKTLFCNLHKLHRLMVDGFILDGPFNDIRKYKTLLLEPEKSGHLTIHGLYNIERH